MNCIGIDIGTHSIKLCLYNNIHDISFYIEKKHHIKNLTLNPKEVLNNIIFLVKKIHTLDQAKKYPPERIAISSLGEAIIPIFQKGGICSSILGPNEIGSGYLDLINTELTKWLNQDINNYFYSIFKVKYLLEENKISIKDSIFCWEDYLTSLWLEQSSMGETIALRTGAFDETMRILNNKLLKVINLENFHFNKVFAAGKLLGTMNREWANRMGFKSYPVVVQGGWDQYCATIGTNIKPGQLMVNFGSVLIMSTILQDNRRHTTFHSVTHERFQLNQKLIDIQLIYSPGLLIQEIEDLIGILDIMDSLDISTQFSKSIFTVNLETKDIIDQNFQSHTISKKSLLMFNTSEIMISILEASAFEVRLRLEWLYNESIEITDIIAVGGGVRIKAWLVILSNVLNLPVKIAHNYHSSALGAALISLSSSFDRKIKKQNYHNCIFPEKKYVTMLNSKYLNYIMWKESL